MAAIFRRRARLFHARPSLGLIFRPASILIAILSRRRPPKARRACRTRRGWPRSRPPPEPPMGPRVTRRLSRLRGRRPSSIGCRISFQRVASASLALPISNIFPPGEPLALRRRSSMISTGLATRMSASSSIQTIRTAGSSPATTFAAWRKAFGSAANFSSLMKPSPIFLNPASALRQNCRDPAPSFCDPSARPLACRGSGLASPSRRATWL